MKAARNPFANVTNRPRRKPPLKNPPLTEAELKLAQKNREARIRKQEKRKQAREQAQREINLFGDAFQKALLPSLDHAASHGNSAPPLGKANMGPGRDL
jgi:hypothetical protein